MTWESPKYFGLPLEVVLRIMMWITLLVAGLVSVSLSRSYHRYGLDQISIIMFVILNLKMYAINDFYKFIQNDSKETRLGVT